MQKRTKKFLLQFAIESIEQIERYMDGLSFDAFVSEPLRHDATILRLQFLGFALRDLSKKSTNEDLQRYLARKAQKYTALTEDHRTTDYQKVWETVTLDLPKLKRKLEQQVL